MKQNKEQALGRLHELLGDFYGLRCRGASASRLSRAQGYLDGYMRSLLEVGLCSRQELLQAVASQRSNSLGPATKRVEVDAA